MRILAIRGENLASLAEPFEIAFDAEPLKAAGLFAITGETGAGKSTILDALCLALYDEFPRVKAAGSNESIPDGDNQPLSATDPRTILRRGAGRGFAEVDFLARDGAVYRARCELNRARGKASGALQPRRRALWKVSADGVLEPLASTIGDVKEKVEALTELTCDQFRRTVLLAQGDFDAFLRADARERAELLEKITGTQIYADVSRRAYERFRETRDALQALRDRRDDIGLLSPEDRAAVEAALADLAVRKTEATAAREAVAALLRRHETIAAATGKRDRAAGALATERVAWEALAEDRARLERLDAVEPLRGSWVKVGECDARLATALQTVAIKADALEAAQAARVDADGRAAEAEAARTAADAACERLALAWEDAGRLDARIGDAAQDQTGKTAARDAARAEAQAATDLVAGLGRRIGEARAKCAEIEAALATDAGLAPLAIRFAELAESLDKRAALLAEIEQLEATRAGAAETLARVGDQRAALDAADAADAETRASCDARLAEKTSALAALDEPAVRERAEALEEAGRIVGRLADACARATEAADAQASAQARREAAAQAWTDARDATRAADEALADLAVRIDEIAPFVDLAEATASEQAARLRATLVPGQPCPVCGGAEHPDAHAAPDGFVEGIRARRAALVAEQDAARTRLAEAKAAQAAAERDGTGEAATVTALAARLEAAASAYADARGAWRALDGLDMPAPPDSWLEAAPALEALATTIAEAHRAARATLRAAEALRSDVEAERARRDAAARAIEGRVTERTALAADEAAATKRVLEADAKIPDRRERRGSIDREWARVYDACGITPGDLDRDAAGVRRVLATRAEQYRALGETQAALAAAIAEDATALARAEERAVATSATADRAQTALDDCARTLMDLRARRAGLLDGEETRTHKDRHVLAAKAAKAAADAAREARDVAAHGLAVAQTDARNADDAAAEARRAQAHAQSAFAAALAARALPRDEALALLGTPPEARDALRGRLKAADDALRDAGSTLTHCESALAEAIAAGAPDEDVPTLEARRAALEEALAALSEEEVGKRAALRQDDAARAQAGALEGEIAAAGQVATLWAEVNDAIGSADGSKFRRYAQSVTLDHLVALANRHLAALSPRYRLERAGGEGGELGLQILDRDLGDERRSTRSLSGGERFLTSLALALALCSLEGRGSFVDTLFIDEGFGTLDAATLDVAIDALETLQSQGRKVGVISHVESMHQRIPVQIRVEKSGGGRSRVRLVAAGALGLAA